MEEKKAKINVLLAIYMLIQKQTIFIKTSCQTVMFIIAIISEVTNYTVVLVVKQNPIILSIYKIFSLDIIL